MILLSGNIGPAAGGVERSLAAMADALLSLGEEVSYLEVHPGTAPPGVHVVPAPVAWGKGLSVVTNPERLRAAIRRAMAGLPAEPRQVWARNAVVAELAAERAREGRVAFIPPGLASDILPFERVFRGSGTLGFLRSAYWRIMGEPLNRRTEARAVRAVDRIVVFSENMRLGLVRDYGAAAGAKTLVIPPGVDSARFRPRAGGEEDPLELAGMPRPRVVYLGRLERRKGIELLLEALDRLPGVTAVVVGDGPEASATRRLVQAMGLEGRVRLVGSRSDPETLMRACDVFAFPSVVEPFGHVMLEALASGLPVVGFTRSSGARVAVEDVVRHGETGILANEVSPSALAGALAEALALLARRPELGRVCREAAEAYTWLAFVTAVRETLSRAPGQEENA